MYFATEQTFISLIQRKKQSRNFFKSKKLFLDRIAIFFFIIVKLYLTIKDLKSGTCMSCFGGNGLSRCNLNIGNKGKRMRGKRREPGAFCHASACKSNGLT